MRKVLEIKDLSTSFPTEAGTALAVDRINLDLESNTSTALVGESGSGKSVTAMSVMRLLDDSAEHATGNITYQGEDLLKLPYSRLKKIRGRHISMIFQEPMTSLNPVFRIGTQLRECVTIHKAVSKEEGHKLCVDMLREVGIPDPEKRLDEYPHQLSGGMKQRVMIAMALITEPDILIADEPTTALDVTIQAQILRLMKSLQQRRGTSILLITHDIGVVAEFADKVAVMYGGKIVEYGSVSRVLKSPEHPYTKALLDSLPSVNTGADKLNTIPGQVPPAWAFGSGCRFAGRCQSEIDICAGTIPELKPVQSGSLCACHLTDKENP